MTFDAVARASMGQNLTDLRAGWSDELGRVVVRGKVDRYPVLTIDLDPDRARELAGELTAAADRGE